MQRSVQPFQSQVQAGLKHRILLNHAAIVYRAIACLLALSACTLSAGKLAIREAQVFTADSRESRNRGDEGLAIDGDPKSIGHLTPSNSKGPHVVAYSLGGEAVRINRIRVAKIGDTSSGGTGDIDSMDLEILVTSDTIGHLRDRSYRRVQGVRNGFLGEELIEAASVSADGVIDNDRHDFNQHGWYSISFDETQATAVAIRFVRDSGDLSPWTHYGTYEFEAHYDAILDRQARITDVAIFRDNPERSSNTRGDQGLAIDGNVRTWSYLTSSSSTGPHFAAFDFGGLKQSVNRLRVFKFGDIDGFTGFDHMDLEILYTTDGGALRDRNYQRVRGLRSGHLGQEKVNAVAVHPDGRVFREWHHTPSEGPFSLVFNTVEATGVAIRLNRNSLDPYPWSHYRLYELQAFHEPDTRDLFTPTSLQVFDATAGTLNERGDQLLSIDGDVQTFSYLTPSFTQGRHFVAYGLGDSREINQIRVAKIGDTTGGSSNPADVKPMDLEIFYSTGTGELRQRSYRRVSGLSTGHQGFESIQAAAIDPDGLVTDETHEFLRNGYYTLSFNRVNATAIAIGFSRDGPPDSTFIHYPVRELQVGAAAGGAVQNQIQGVAVFNANTRALNNRGDQNLAIDGSTETIGHLTPAFSKEPHIVAYDLGGGVLRVNRIRIAKIGDTTGGSSNPDDVKPMDLEILYTLDSGPLEGRTYRRIQGLRNGFNGTELLKAGRVSPDGTVREDRHDFGRDGFFSFTFPSLNATAVAIRFDRSGNNGELNVHYGTYEFQALLEPDGVSNRPSVGVAVFRADNKQLNQRGDEANAIDGDLSTIGHLTPSGTFGAQIVSYDLGSAPKTVNRIRVAKIGDTNGGGSGDIDKMDLEILYTNDSGPLEGRNYQRVSKLQNGFFGAERIKAASVNLDGTVEDDRHDFATGGFYSLTFDTVEATAIAIRFDRDDRGSGIAVHYGTYEFQAHDGPAALPPPGSLFSGNVVNVDIGNNALMADDDILGNPDPFWNRVNQDVTTNLKDAAGESTSIGLHFSGASSLTSNSSSQHPLLNDMYWRHGPQEAFCEISGLNSSSLYRLFIFTGSAGGQYRIGDERRFAAYLNGDDPARGNATDSLQYVIGRNTVLFDRIQPDFDGKVLIRYNANPSDPQYDFGEFAGITIQEVAPILNPIHGDIQAGNSPVYSGPSILNEGNPFWNALTQDNHPRLLDAAGLVTSAYLTLAGANGRHQTDWTGDALLGDFLFREANGIAQANLGGLPPNQTFDLILYTGTEGGEYWIGNTRRTAQYNGLGVNGDPHYSAHPVWVEGKNHVRFRSLSPDEAGNIAIRYRSNPATGLNGNFSGFTLIPTGSGTGRPFKHGLIVNADIGGQAVYEGLNVFGDGGGASSFWNQTTSDVVSSLRNLRGEVTPVALTFGNASGLGDSSLSAHPLLTDHYYRHGYHSEAWCFIDGLASGGVYSIAAYTGVEGGRYRIGDKTLFANYQNKSDSAYGQSNGDIAFELGRNYVLFNGVEADASGRISLYFNDNAGDSLFPNGNLAGLTIRELAPLTIPVHIDVQAGGGSAVYSGPSALNDGSPVWNATSSDLELHLLDAGGNATTVYIGARDASGRHSNTSWTGHALLQDFLFEDGGVNAEMVIHGLSPDQAFDIYVYTGLEGGDYFIGGEQKTALYSGQGPGGDGAYAAGSDWIEGKNYVVFRSIAPDNQGKIRVRYGDSPASVPSNGNLSGLTIAPAGTVPRPVGTGLEGKPVVSGSGSGGLAGVSLPGGAGGGSSVLPSFDSVTMSMAEFISGNFEPGRYREVRILEPGWLERLQIYGLTFSKAVLQTRGGRVLAEKGFYNQLLMEVGLTQIQIDPQNGLSARAFLKSPWGDAEAGLIARPGEDLQITGGEFALKRPIFIPNKNKKRLILNQIKIVVDPENQRFGGQAVVGFWKKSKNSLDHLADQLKPCGAQLTGVKQFGGSFIMSNNQVEEVSLIGNQLMIQPWAPSLVFLNRLQAKVKNPQDENNWSFAGTASFGLGCPVKLGFGLAPQFPATVEGELEFGALGAKLTGRGFVLGQPLANATFAADDQGSLLRGQVTLLQTMSGSAELAAKPTGFSGKVTGSLTIPSSVPFVGGKKFQDTASFDGGAIRGGFEWNFGNIPQKCVGGGSHTTCWNYWCGPWYSPWSRTCHACKTISWPAICTPSIPGFTVRVGYTFAGSSFSFSTDKQTMNAQRQVSKRSLKALAAVDQTDTGLQMFTNFREADRYESPENSRIRLFSLEPNIIPLEVPEETPGAIFTLFYEHSPNAGPDFIITFPDGETQVRLSEGPLPTGFDTYPGFGRVVPESQSASIFLSSPPAGTYEIQILDEPALGEFSVEVLAEEPRLEIEIVDVQPTETERVFEITYRGVDPDDIAEVTLYVGSDRTGFDADLVAILDKAAGEHTVTVDLNDLGLYPGQYYFAAIMEDGIREPVQAITDRPVRITDPNAPAPVTDIRLAPADGALGVEWEPSPGPNVEEYLVLYSYGDNQNLHQFENWEYADPESNRLTINYLDNGRPYLVTVVAVNSDGNESEPVRILRGIPTRGFGFNPPVIVSIPDENVTALSPYLYVPAIFDADLIADNSRYADLVETSEDLSRPSYTWTLLEGPEGMTIDEFGTILWTPTSEQVGEHWVAIEVVETPPEDMPGLSPDDTFYDTQDFLIEVYEENDVLGLNEHPYRFLTFPNLTATEGTLYRYDPQVLEPEGGVFFEIKEGPEGLSVDGQSIVWDVPAGAKGAQTRVVARTAAGDRFEQTWYLDVVVPVEVDATANGVFSFSETFLEFDDFEFYEILINREEGTFGTVPLLIGVIDPNGEPYVTIPVTFVDGQISQRVDITDALWENEELIDAEELSIRLSLGPGAPEGTGLDEERSHAHITILNTGGGSAVAYMPKVFRPEIPFLVQIELTPWYFDDGQAYFESIPPGWAVTDISHDGVYDEESGGIFWGPYPDYDTRLLSYWLVPPPDAEDYISMEGYGYFDDSEILAIGRRTVVNADRYTRYTNPSRIEISPFGPGNIYPATIQVEGLGNITGPPLIGVNGILHDYYFDLSFVVEGPNGQNVALTGNAEMFGNWDPVNLLYADGADSPYRFGEEIQSGAHAPLNEDPQYHLPAPAPAGPYGEALGVFENTDPNGTWSFFAMDSIEEDGGIIESWELYLPHADAGVNLAPSISAIHDRRLLINQSTGEIEFRIEDDRTPRRDLFIEVTSSNTEIISNFGIETDESGENPFIVLTPEPDAIGETTIKVSVEDDEGGIASTEFSITYSDVPAQSLSLTIDQAYAKSGGLTIVPIRVKGFDDINSLSMSLSWDSSNLTLDENKPVEFSATVKDGDSRFPLITSSHLQLVQPGLLVVTWEELSQPDLGRSLEDGSILFALRLKTARGLLPGEHLPIEFIDDPAPVQALDNSGNPRTVATGFNGVEIKRRVRVRGQVHYWAQQGLPVPGVSLIASGHDGEFDFVDSDGNGAFEVTVPTDTEVYIDVELPGNENANAGVSVLDILLMRKHILAVEPFENPLQLLAGDVTEDESISTLDILTTRRVILGITDYFTLDYNDEKAGIWKFIRNDYTFEDSLDPFLEYYIEDTSWRFMESVDGDRFNSDFLAIKLGDVSGNWAPEQVAGQSFEGAFFGGSNSPIQKSSIGNDGIADTYFLIPDVEAVSSSVIEVPVRLGSVWTGDEAGSLLGIQFELHWNSDFLAFVGAESSTLPGFSADSHSHATDGRLRVAWDNPFLSGAKPPAGTDELEILVLKFTWRDSDADAQSTAIEFNPGFESMAAMAVWDSGFVSHIRSPVQAKVNVSTGTPQILGMTIENGAFLLQIGPVIDQVTYVIESTGSLEPGTWKPLGEVLGNGTTVQFLDSRPAEGVQYYRVVSYSTVIRPISTGRIDD